MYKRILIIEDDVNVVLDWKEALKRFPYELTVATDLQKAQDLFLLGNWSCIVVDGCLGGDSFNTKPLVKKIRESGYGGPMIAASASPEIRLALVEAGCNEQSVKEFVPATLMHALSQ